MKKVLVFGTFDILHPGHIHFLQQAKKHGDYLIVSIARDGIAQKIKRRALLHSELDRKKLLESVRFVDKVILGSKKDYLTHIISLEPDVIVLGYDQKAFTDQLEQRLVKKGFKVKIVRAKAYQPKYYKSSKLIK